MIADSVERFSARVSHYVRFRPGYPAAVADLLRRECAPEPDALIADIGSGTGFLGRTLLDGGFRVLGVEPNGEMRAAGDEILRGYAGFKSVNGTAEATTLEAASCDLAVAGQAFHWFDVERTRSEWRRILKPGRFGALIWNERSRRTDVMREIEEVIDRFATDHDRSIREGGRGRIAGFFSPAAVNAAEFPNYQDFDFEGLKGRVHSCSYIPHEDDPRSEPMVEDLRRVFEKYERGGTIRFEYRTEVYWGKLT
ncbi:MAG TPA: class I SAM-dependent methyltransferase [Bryobacteraceae bacterium]|nr:class I SAM-dependent methyltransferase [Bryobacteraceae bacterium]